MLVALLVAIIPLTQVAGCSSPEPPIPTAISPEKPLDPAEASLIIDVRTPEEFAEGHLKGAVNMDVLADDFNSKIEALSRQDGYIVYCKSGVRSATAAARMKAMGFTRVSDAGAIADATVSTGLAIVTT